jgi:DNA-binding transcriptional MerR regulator
MTTETTELRVLPIGLASRLAGCSSSWVRRLEEAGAIDKAERTPTGRRLFSLADVEMIRRSLAMRREADREPLPAA